MSKALVVEPKGKIDIENPDPETEKFLVAFQKEVSQVKSTFAEINSTIAKLKELQLKVLKSTVGNEKKDLKKQCEKLVAEIGSKNKSTRITLESFGKETEKRKDELKGKITTEIRIREANHVQLCLEFKGIVGTYQELQEDFKRRNSELAFKQLKIANPTKRDDEIQEMMMEQEQDRTSLSKSQQGTLNAYYDEAVETRRDVLEIEKSLIELQELFITMEKLVDQQDMLLDNVEANCERSVEYIAVGNDLMKDAANLGIAQGASNIVTGAIGKIFGRKTTK